MLAAYPTAGPAAGIRQRSQWSAQAPSELEECAACWMKSKPNTSDKIAPDEKRSAAGAPRTEGGM